MSHRLVAFCLLLLPGCADNVPGPKSVTIRVESIAPSGEIEYRIVNKSGRQLCTSSLTSGRNVQENVFKYFDGTGSPLEIVKNSGLTESFNDRKYEEIVLEGDSSISSRANVFDFFYFTRVGTYQFDISIPVFPCGDQEVALITRDWEDAYGPEYLKERGVLFPVSPRYRHTVDNLETQRRNRSE